MADKLMKPIEVQEDYGWSTKTLRQWRWLNKGPDFIRVGEGPSARIRYRQSAIEAYLDAHTVQTGGAAA